MRMPRANPKKIHYKDTFQTYTYELVESVGKHFDVHFTPDLTPKEMLRLGVFGGAYFVGVRGGVPTDVPKAWFQSKHLSPDNKKRKNYNYFGVSASQPLAEWQRKGWIHPRDPHGWFQWYCRYYMGRRIEKEDQRQIKRWKAFRRHAAQVKKFCKKGDMSCRRRQRQALLHWAYDSRNF